MAVYVYRRASSTSARSLATAVEGSRWRRPAPPTALRSGDVVVCWGEAAPPNVPAGVQVINGAAIRNKLSDAEVLRNANVATIEAVRTRPPVAPPVPTIDPAIAAWERAQDLAGDFTEIETLARTPVLLTGLVELIHSLNTLNQTLGRPAPVAVAAPVDNSVWLPRMFNHVGGNDLLTIPTTPDYYSRKIVLQEEYRVHSFDGRSIRAGRKVLRDGYSLPGQRSATGVTTAVASTWIRSFDGGWRINYDGFESTRAMRELAAAACNALGLVFGAVDIGQTTDGRLVVLEVNRAPGLEGGTITAYASALNRWVTEHGTAEARRAA